MSQAFLFSLACGHLISLTSTPIHPSPPFTWPPAPHSTYDVLTEVNSDTPASKFNGHRELSFGFLTMSYLSMPKLNSPFSSLQSVWCLGLNFRCSLQCCSYLQQLSLPSQRGSDVFSSDGSQIHQTQVWACVPNYW